MGRVDLGRGFGGGALGGCQAALGWFPRNRVVGEDVVPPAPAALDVARHGGPGRLDLARRETPAGRGLQAVLAEGDLGAAGGYTLVAALLLLAVLASSWLQHVSLPVCLWVSFRARVAARRAARPCPAPRP